MKAACAGLILNGILNLLFLGGGAVGAAAPWEIVENEPSTFGSVHWCSTYRVVWRVMGSGEAKEVCMYGGETFQFGLVADSGYQLVAKHVLDESFRPVRIECGGGCVYNAETDFLIVRRPGLVLNIFTGVSKRLEVGGLSSYDLDVSKPDYQVVDSVGSISMSENGVWLAVEVKNRGIDRINLQTHERIRVIEPGVQYGFGHDPVVELGISNDGRYVAQMGEEAGFLVVEVSELCSGGCPVVSMSVAELSPHFYFAGHPRFDSGSSRLSFGVATYELGSRRVTIQKPGYQTPEVSYLALGDSFSSGEGEVDDRFYRLGRDDLFSRCHQSTRAYPVLLGFHMGLSSTSSHSVACAGARIPDIIHPMETYLGQTSRLSRVSDFERRRLQSEALDAYLPGRVPQDLFVEQYQPTVVTIGIGGNDAGFMSKLKTCAMPDLCEWAENPAYRYATAEEIQRLFYSLQEVYRQIQHHSRSSRIYAVGYPEVINPEGVCGPVTSTLLTYSERLFMQQGVRYLNQVIRAAAEASRVGFLDVEQAFTGNRLCDIGVPAVNGLRLGDDVAVFSTLKIIGNESFHPTPYGHKLLSEAIPDLRIPDAPDRAMDTEPPPFPAYWGESTGSTFPTFYNEAMSANHIPLGSPQVAVQLPPMTFTPNSWVNIELHSDAKILNRVQVSGDGSLRAVASVNSELAVGYHTLHIFGDAYSGGPVDVYNIVSYGDFDGAPLGGHESSESVRSVPGVLSLAVANNHEVRTSGTFFTRILPGSFLPIFITIFVLVVIVVVGMFMVRSIIKSAQDRGG